VWDHVRWWEPVVRRARPKSRLARLAPTAASPRRGVKLIASGRASDIFDLEDGRVLRRFKGGGDAEREALVMRHALSRGYPVPRVLEVTSDGLVLERVEGQTMSAALRRRPWMLRQHCFLPARLHDKLHALPTPARLRAIGTGDRLLHFDLHPDNVILSPAGPVVIDWSNAHRGEAALDVALTWIILATSAGPPAGCSCAGSCLASSAPPSSVRYLGPRSGGLPTPTSPMPSARQCAVSSRESVQSRDPVLMPPGWSRREQARSPRAPREVIARDRAPSGGARLAVLNGFDVVPIGSSTNAP
jgi:hypothetical protein